MSTTSPDISSRKPQNSVWRRFVDFCARCLGRKKAKNPNIYPIY